MGAQAKLFNRLFWLADTIEAKLIKMENPESESRKFASYVPYYACFYLQRKSTLLVTI